MHATHITPRKDLLSHLSSIKSEKRHLPIAGVSLVLSCLGCGTAARAVLERDHRGLQCSHIWVSSPFCAILACLSCSRITNADAQLLRHTFSSHISWGALHIAKMLRCTEPQYVWRSLQHESKSEHCLPGIGG